MYDVDVGMLCGMLYVEYGVSGDGRVLSMNQMEWNRVRAGED